MTNLTNAAAFEDMPAWSPNGEQIAFMRFSQGYCAIYVMDANGTNQVNVTPLPVGVAAGDWCNGWPAWSRDGQQIYFFSFRPGTTGRDIFVMNADGSDPRQLTNAAGHDVAPTAR